VTHDTLKCDLQLRQSARRAWSVRSSTTSMECSTAGEGIIDHQRAPGVQNTWRPKDPLVGSPNPHPICPDLEAAGPPPSRGEASTGAATRNHRPFILLARPHTLFSQGQSIEDGTSTAVLEPTSSRVGDYGCGCGCGIPCVHLSARESTRGLRSLLHRTKRPGKVPTAPPKPLLPCSLYCC
jgi:hypothetical protein